MTGVAYAVGKYALAECQKCGLRLPYSQLVSDGQWRDLRVCPGCFDPRHPQERLKRVSDPIALWRPAPESRWPPTAPVLAGEFTGSANSLTWTSSDSPDSAVAGYRLYRQAPDETDFTLLVELEVERNYIGAIEVEPLAYLDESPAVGEYSYYVLAFDLRGLPSANSNTVTLTVTADSPPTDPFLDITVGEHPTLSTYPLGYELLNFNPANPPLLGETDPDPPVVDGSRLYAVWCHHDNDGLEMWWSLNLPANCTTLRVQTASGHIDLDFVNPTQRDDFPEGQSYIYWATVMPWTEADVGQTYRLTFLE